MKNLKKTTLIMIASASMLFAAPAMDTNMNMQGKGMKMMKKNKMSKKKMNSPFLIKHGLPHLSKMIMPYMNDPAFNLTADQKEQLAKVRTTTMSAIMEAKPIVMALKKEIVNASAAGVSAEVLKDKVAKLALLEAAATMTHLKCIESTKAILTKDQLYFLLANKSKKMNHGKKRMMANKKGMKGNRCKGMGQNRMMNNCKCRMNNK